MTTKRYTRGVLETVRKAAKENAEFGMPIMRLFTDSVVVILNHVDELETKVDQLKTENEKLQELVRSDRTEE